MPGIAGIISPLERESLQPVLSHMRMALPCREERSSQVWAGGPAGIFVCGPAPQKMIAVDPTGAASPERVLAVIGQAARDSVFRERLSAATEAVHSAQSEADGLASQLLQIYSRFGPAGLEGLNGAYVAAIWEARSGRLTLVGDRAGLQPFFYWQEGERVLFASRVQAIAGHPQFRRVINPVALFDLLAAEQMLDERTLFRDIHALPPAGLLTFESGRLDVRSYWQPGLYAPGGRDPDEGEAIEGLAEHILSAVSLLLENLNEAAENMPSAGPSLLLTGGLDSRTLAGSLARCRKETPVTANTIGHAQARDVRYGQKIAQATGLPYTVLPANPNYLADYAAEFVRRTDGGSNVHASWILEELGYLQQAGIPAVFTGVGAEAVSGRHWLSEQPVTTRQEALERLCEARWTYSQAAALLRPEIREDAWQASRESVRRTLDEAPADTVLGWSDYFAYRQNRRHPTGNVLSDDVLVLEPFFENALVDYAYRLPPVLRNKGVLYKKMIIQRFPELAGIGYTDSGMLLSKELNGFSAGQAWMMRIKDLERRARRRVGRQIPLLRRGPSGDNPAQAIYYNHWLRTSARSFVEDILRREALYADYLDAPLVHRMVEEHMTGRRDAFRLINGVVTFALWREIAGN